MCAAVAAAAFPSAARAEVKIDGSVTVVESAQAIGPVERATKDLLSDFNKVFGTTPRLVTTLADAGPVSIVIGQGPEMPFGLKCSMATDTEAFAFSIVKLPGKKQAVCLTGADMRGTIFAIYEFSQAYLGIDPMYLWTDKQPEKRSSIALPADFARVYPKPVFRYRGFFPNDEDLLTGWVPAEKGEQTGISPKTWDKVYETILRLKGNMVVPGTWIFPDDAQVHLATERGLIVNQHHAIPLGVNVARWPKDVPYNYSTHPEILERAWTNAVATYKPDAEILWSVGLRGLSDQSYAALDPSVRDNDPLLGERVSAAIADQMKIVRAKYPKAQFVTDLWQEGARLMDKGYLKIPPEVTLVWADTGYGDMQDGGKVAAGQGAYFHVAMMNGEANQLSEMVPVERIQSELGRYIKAGATSYLLVNTSDIRPVAMTTRALMEVAWGGVPAGGDGDFYRRWATEEFGAKSVDALTALYREYFAAPALRPQPQLSGSDADADRGDAGVWRPALSLGDAADHSGYAERAPGGGDAEPVSQVDAAAVVSGVRRADAKDAAGPGYSGMRGGAGAMGCGVGACGGGGGSGRSRRGATTTRQDVLTMITINRESNRALMLVAKAVEDDEAGRTEQARSEAAEALRALDAVQESMAKAEYGQWKNWYRGDWLTGVYRTRELVQSYADHLQDRMAKLPAPMLWSGWEAYFHIMEYEGDRTVDVK